MVRITTEEYEQASNFILAKTEARNVKGTRCLKILKAPRMKPKLRKMDDMPYLNLSSNETSQSELESQLLVLPVLEADGFNEGLEQWNLIIPPANPANQQTHEVQKNVAYNLITADLKPLKERKFSPNNSVEGSNIKIKSINKNIFESLNCKNMKDNIGSYNINNNYQNLKILSKLSKKNK
jgi:hypothetical protein